MPGGFYSLVAMSALLGGASFGIGMLPLFFKFSKHSLSRVSIFGSGLLLGAALGVVVPEGIETIVESSEDHEVPTNTIALSLILGFAFMLFVERAMHSKSHHHQSSLSVASEDPPKSSQLDRNGNEVVFDVELGDLERTEGFVTENIPSSSTTQSGFEVNENTKKKAYPLTLGLVIHALADGLALGSSALSSGSAVPSSLSTVVFLALIIHKAPASLALSTSLLSTSLPRTACRKHLAVFSASTPLGALASYCILSLLGVSGHSSWSGIALLFSGGTFIYVATVLRPGATSSDDVGEVKRFLIAVGGMLAPLAISPLFGDVHHH
ncbi:Zinc/iron permease [Abortiporus biennis]